MRPIGLAIGWAAGPQGVTTFEPLFFDLFKGVLALFLLEMGLIAAGQVKALREWLPLVFVDLHEMRSDSTYYFAPEAMPCSWTAEGLPGRFWNASKLRGSA